MRAVFAKAWAIYRRDFWLMTALLVTIWTPAQFVLQYLAYHAASADDVFLYQKLSIFYFQLIGVIATTGFLFIFRERDQGYQPDYLSALGFGLKCWWKIFITRVIVTLLVLLGFALLILPGIYLAVRVGLSESVVVAEGLSGAAAARRSGDLTRDRFGEILLWWVVGLAPILFLNFVPAYLGELEIFNDWISQSVLCSVQDFSLPMLYSLGWAIYSRVRADEGKVKAILHSEGMPEP